MWGALERDRTSDTRFRNEVPMPAVTYEDVVSGGPWCSAGARTARRPAGSGVLAGCEPDVMTDVPLFDGATRVRFAGGPLDGQEADCPARLGMPPLAVLVRIEDGRAAEIRPNTAGSDPG